MIVTCTNQKGGVAKTSTCLELAYNLKARGYSVLLIDVDPQANLSKVANGKGIPYDRGTMQEVLKYSESIFDKDADHYQGPVYQVNMGIDLIPSPPNQMLANIQTELNAVTGREFRLREALSVLFSRQNYDFVIIDTPPSLGVLTVNALSASDRVLIPSVPEDFSIDGLLQLNQTFQAVKKFCNPNVEYDGILLTRVLQRTNVHRAYVAETAKCSDELKIKVYRTYIPGTITVPESQGMRMPLMESAAHGTATEKYKEFCTEFLLANGYKCC